MDVHDPMSPADGNRSMALRLSTTRLTGRASLVASVCSPALPMTRPAGQGALVTSVCGTTERQRFRAAAGQNVDAKARPEGTGGRVGGASGARRGSFASGSPYRMRRLTRYCLPARASSAMVFKSDGLFFRRTQFSRLVRLCSVTRTCAAARAALQTASPRFGSALAAFW